MLASKEALGIKDGYKRDVYVKVDVWAYEDGQNKEPGSERVDRGCLIICAVRKYVERIRTCEEKDYKLIIP